MTKGNDDVKWCDTCQAEEVFVNQQYAEECSVLAIYEVYRNIKTPRCLGVFLFRGKLSEV